MLPFISHFGSGISREYFSIMFTIVLLLSLKPITRGASQRHAEIKRLKRKQQQAHPFEQPVQKQQPSFLLCRMQKFLPLCSFSFFVASVLLLLLVIFFPWNYYGGGIHVLAALTAIGLFQTAMFIHLLGTFLLWRIDPGRWAVALRKQVLTIAGPPLCQLCCVAVFTILGPAKIIDPFEGLYVSKIHYQGIQNAADTNESWLAFCEVGISHYLGWEGYEYFIQFGIIGEWVEFLRAAVFIVLAAQEPEESMGAATEGEETKEK